MVLPIPAALPHKNLEDIVADPGIAIEYFENAFTRSEYMKAQTIADSNSDIVSKKLMANKLQEYFARTLDVPANQAHCMSIFGKQTRTPKWSVPLHVKILYQNMIKYREIAQS